MAVRFMVIPLGILSGLFLLGLLAEGVGLNAPFYVSAVIVMMVASYLLACKPQLLPGRRE